MELTRRKCPQPEERPLRIKRPRKSNANNNDSVEDDPPHHNDNEDVVAPSSSSRRPGAAASSSEFTSHRGGGGSSLDRLASAAASVGVSFGSGADAAPTQEELTSSFRVQAGNNNISTNGSATPAAAAMVDGRGNRRQSGSGTSVHNTNTSRRHSGRPTSAMDSKDVDEDEDSTDIKAPKKEEEEGR